MSQLPRWITHTGSPPPQPSICPSQTGLNRQLLPPHSSPSSHAVIHPQQPIPAHFIKLLQSHCCGVVPAGELISPQNFAVLNPGVTRPRCSSSLLPTSSYPVCTQHVYAHFSLSCSVNFNVDFAATGTSLHVLSRPHWHPALRQEKFLTPSHCWMIKNASPLISSLLQILHNVDSPEQTGLIYFCYSFFVLPGHH